MRSVVYHSYGEPSIVLKVQEGLDVPTPGEGEVLIGMRLTPLLHGSLLAVRGRYRGPRDNSEVPAGGARQGYEGVGVVEAVGKGVPADNGLRVGRRVAFFPGFGAWAERIAVPAAFVTPVPDDIPDEIAAQIHINPLTAIMLLGAAVDAGAHPDGDHGIVLDAGGASVGKFLTELARRRNIPVVSVVRSREAAEKLRILFPGTEVLVSNEDDWLKGLERAAPKGGFIAGIDAVGGPVGSAILDNLAQGGTLITYGDLSGEPLQANALSFAMRDTHVRGLVVTRWPALPAARRQHDVALAIELARDRPDLFPVAAQYRFDDIAEAARHVERPGRDGLVLLTPGI